MSLLKELSLCILNLNICYFVNDIGCDDLNLSSEDFKTTSEIACQNVTNSVKCEVGCQVGYNAVFPNFLKIQCYNNKWIRKNNIGKYVRLANANAPPRCYGKLTENFLLTDYNLCFNRLCVKIQRNR